MNKVIPLLVAGLIFAALGRAAAASPKASPAPKTHVFVKLEKTGAKLELFKKSIAEPLPVENKNCTSDSDCGAGYSCCSVGTLALCKSSC